MRVDTAGKRKGRQTGERRPHDRRRAEAWTLEGTLGPKSMERGTTPMARVSVGSPSSLDVHVEGRNISKETLPIEWICGGSIGADGCVCHGWVPLGFEPDLFRGRKSRALFRIDCN